MIVIPAARKLLLQIVAAALPLSALWIVALSNALNLLDGIDGFGGGIAHFAALGFGVIGLAREIFWLPPLPVLWLSRIFMGDGGSLVL